LQDNLFIVTCKKKKSFRQCSKKSCFFRFLYVNGNRIGKLFSDFFMSIENKIGNLFFQISSFQSKKKKNSDFLMSIGKQIIWACNPNQMDQPITADGAWSTRHLNKYDCSGKFGIKKHYSLTFGGFFIAKRNLLTERFKKY